MTRVPLGVRSKVQAALGEYFGRTAGELTTSRVGGGCISPAARVQTEAGDVAFLKWAEPDTPPGLFTAEARSLEALREADAVRVPEVIAVSDTEPGGSDEIVAARDGERSRNDGHGGGHGREGEPDADGPTAGIGESSWILMEWLEPGPSPPAMWKRLGTRLAALHQARVEHYGWPTDNFIGSLPQPNDWLDDWTEFWRVRRLEPQLRLAYDAGWFEPSEREQFDTLLDRLDDHLAPAAGDGPSLLHGDLWSGNVHAMADDEPALIDPASFFGHREVDLAMAELFGGFDTAFYHAYHEAWPLAPGCDETRRTLYQLYYLLVHVNLFGGGYVARTISAVDALT